MPSPRVLVADDHAETRQWIAALLESQFDVVAAVADGQAAVDAVAALRPDVVVLDISMPVLNGFEAAAIIGQLSDSPRIVFCTAYDDPDFARAAFELGASALVLKRNMRVELVSAIRQALVFHAVHFYEDTLLLARTVGRFIGAGLVAEQPAVLIARPSHSAAIVDQLRAMSVDPRPRIEQGELVVLDADEVLNRFMVDAMPDTQRFDDALDPIVARLAGSRKRMVRVYGEMVDILWAKDNQAAALSLEILWNQLIARRKCSLLCGYSLEGVGKGTGFNEICEQHSHVVSR